MFSYIKLTIVMLTTNPRQTTNPGPRCFSVLVTSLDVSLGTVRCPNPFFPAKRDSIFSTTWPGPCLRWPVRSMLSRIRVFTAWRWRTFSGESYPNPSWRPDDARACDEEMTILVPPVAEQWVGKSMNFRHVTASIRSMWSPDWQGLTDTIAIPGLQVLGHLAMDRFRIIVTLEEHRSRRGHLLRSRI